MLFGINFGLHICHNHRLILIKRTYIDYEIGSVDCQLQLRSNKYGWYIRIEAVVEFNFKSKITADSIVYRTNWTIHETIPFTAMDITMTWHQRVELNLHVVYRWNKKTYFIDNFRCTTIHQILLKLSFKSEQKYELLPPLK